MRTWYGSEIAPSLSETKVPSHSGFQPQFHWSLGVPYQPPAGTALLLRLITTGATGHFALFR